MPDSDLAEPSEGMRPLQGGGGRSRYGGELSPPAHDERLAALLSYLLGWITGLIMYFTGNSRYVRFHALQSIILFGAITAIQLFLFFVRKIMIAFVGLSGAGALLVNFCALFTTILWVGTLILWAFLMAKAYQGESYRFAVAGEIAAKAQS
jgi:uncharacterized membrane protein